MKGVNFMGSVIRIRMEVGDETMSFDMFNSPDLVPPAVGDHATAHVASRDMFELAT